MLQILALPVLVLAVTALLALPIGRFLAWIADGHYRPPRWLAWVERRLDTGPQTWKQYGVSLLLFNTVMFVVAFAILALQPLLPLNPDEKRMLAPTTVFHTALSFVTNNSQQHYAGEQHLSYFSQLVAIVWSMFVSGGVGLCALVAVIRGLRGDTHLGNFYLDLWRAVAYVLVPATVPAAVLFLAAGVPMTLDGAAPALTMQAGAMGAADGESLPQRIARGPVAPLVAVKNLASVGGGFFGANSTHPFENPNAWSNLLTCVSILLFPVCVVVMFGRMLNNARHAAVLLGVMAFLLVAMIGLTIYWDTLQPNPALTGHVSRTYPVTVPRAPTGSRTIMVPALAGLPVDQDLGNIEGKELRFGTSAGATCVAVTTAVSCGTVNCMHDSLNPLAGLVAFGGMWLNCVFGAKGVGTINLLLFLLVGVFITGLMVGRTPEYLGKKVEAREMKLAMLALLVHPFLILVPAGLFAACTWGLQSTSNPGPHGFSQILYEFSSASAGNGSGFEGLQDTWGFNDNSDPAPYSPQWDVACGLVMLLSRFLPILAPLALVGGLAAKPPTPFTVGTLRTDTVTFAFVLLGTILLLGALLFLPAAVLGPVAEHLGPLPFGG
jgi:potassium-transporting ATPase potassium-binding subunit